MAATRDDISAWFNRGVEEGAEFMVVATDTFDWEDYPVYASHQSEIAGIISRQEKVMEVYSLLSDKAFQMNEHRANHREHFILASEETASGFSEVMVVPLVSMPSEFTDI